MISVLRRRSKCIFRRWPTGVSGLDFDLQCHMSNSETVSMPRVVKSGDSPAFGELQIDLTKRS
jgi:hypothetical protein